MTFRRRSDARDQLELLLMVVLIGIILAFYIHAKRLEAQIHERTTQRDSLAGEAAAERARANGFEVAFGTYMPHLAKELKKGDSILAVTIGDLQVSRARILQLNRITVGLEGQISSMGTPGAALTDDTEAIPSSWVGEYDDDLLRGSWTFDRIPAPLLSLDYFSSPVIELVQSTSGDGRTLVLLRGLDPRVTPIFTELLVDPLPPVIELHCPVSRLGIAGLIGAGTALLLKKDTPEEE